MNRLAPVVPLRRHFSCVNCCKGSTTEKSSSRCTGHRSWAHLMTRHCSLDSSPINTALFLPGDVPRGDRLLAEHASAIDPPSRHTAPLPIAYRDIASVPRRAAPRSMASIGHPLPWLDVMPTYAEQPICKKRRFRVPVVS